ncbi:hypothetical protein IMZ48_13705 [Candidatus Bathyarchaeota archaeon]|nr:hypothetical protein [Candidatus Bathyarchaeota archaeon]
MDTRFALERHLNENHKDLDTEERLQHHPVSDAFLNRNKKVRFYKDQRCSIRGCKSVQIFKVFTKYVKHAKEKHGVKDRDDMLEHVQEKPPSIPDKKRPSSAMQSTSGNKRRSTSDKNALKISDFYKPGN